MHEAKVAIIISTYNRKELLTRSLNSLFNSFDKIKPSITIWDDGSTDGTYEYLTSLEAKGLICRQPHSEHKGENRGLRAVLNSLLDLAMVIKTDYICYCQDDIEYEKGWLDKCVEKWEENHKFPKSFKGYKFVKFGFITGHDAPEHPVKAKIGDKYYLKDTCRATHLFASTERWKEFGEIPDLTPGIAAPKPGHGSLVDWWLMGHPEGKFPESENSLKKRGEKVLCIPGLIKHIATEPDKSTWHNKTFERGKFIKDRIGIQIITRNRPEYLATLLCSLRTQTIQNFDIFIVDNSDIPIVESHQLKCLFERLSWEGHRVKIARHPARDIGFLRNIALDLDDCEFGCRIDDDSICDPEMLERLSKVFQAGAGVGNSVGCVGPMVPFIHQEKQFRPVPPKMCQVTKFFDLTDESIYFFNTDKEFIPCDHVRSSMMYRNEVAKKIRHPEGFGKTGYREETVFSYRFILHGYNNYYVPKAICWHFAAPSGGGRDEQDPQNTFFLNDQKMKELLSNEIQATTQPKGIQRAGKKQGP